MKFFDNIVCLSPNSIPNPNYGVKCKPGDFNSFKDCSSRYIRVPCGYCSECIKTKQMYIIQRVQMESIDKYIFYGTMTYNQKWLPSVTTSTGYTIKYADWHHLQNCLKRLRKDFSRPFKYLAVSERGSKRSRPHFHILFFVPKYDDDYSIPYTLEKELWSKLKFHWSVNVGTNRKPVYDPLLTYQRRVIRGRVFTNYDLHYVRPSVDSDANSSVGFYVTKYLLKPSDKDRRLQQALHLNLSSDEYEDLWKIVKSRIITSKGFGLAVDSNGDISPKVISYLRDCIDKSSDFPKFYNPVNGKGFPLSRYYRNKGAIYKVDDALRFYMSKDSDSVDSVPIYDVVPHSVIDKKLRDYEKISNESFYRGDFDSVADMFD